MPKSSLEFLIRDAQFLAPAHEIHHLMKK